MSKVRIYGDTSGYVDIAVPAVAGTTTLNLDKIPQADISGNIAMDTDTLYVDAANNRVGIGTTGPDGKLTVALENSNTPAFRLSSPTSSNDFAISSYNDSNGTYVALGVNHLFNSGGNDAIMDTNKKSASIVLDGRNNGRIQFLTANTGIPTTRMTLDKDGNFGIGTDSPNQLLEVSGNGKKSRFTRSGSAGTLVEYYYGGSPAGGIQVQSTGLGIGGAARENDLFIKTDGKVGIGTTSPYAILQTEQDVTGEATGIALVNNNVDGASDSVGISFGLARDNGYLFGFNAIKFIKEQAWTTAPSTVDSALTFSTVLNESLGERMRIDSSGNVGIGMNPTGYLTSGYNLRLYGGTQTYLSFNNSTHTTQVLGGFVIGNDGGAARITQRENQPLVIATNDTTAMTIDSSGRVTIPSQPVFSVSRTGTQATGSSYTAIQFQSNSSGTINEGNCWNFSNHRFTAPVAGKYEFAWGYGTNSPAGQSVWRSYLYVNGSQYVNSQLRNDSNGSTGYVYASRTQILSLSATDYVELRGRADSNADFYADTNLRIHMTGRLIG